MRIRTLTLLSVLALVVAACGGAGSEDGTTSTAADSTTTAPSAEAVLLSYELEPGTSFDYEVDMNQTIDLTTSGDTAALGEEELPGDMSIVLSGTTTFQHTVSDGPEPGTYSIEITGDFSDLEVSGTVDGEPVDPAEVPEMAEMEPVSVTLVVDEQGNVIPDDSGGLGGDFLGDLGGLDMLDEFGMSGGPGQFVGPPLPDEEVTVGDTWSETIEVPAMPDDEPITTQIDNEVLDTDTIDGTEVFVIGTTTTTSPVEFDLAELLVGFLTAFVPEDATDEEMAEMEALAEQLRFAFSIDETVGEMTSWFDFEAGVTRQAEYTSDTHMVMDVNIPDETTGEMVEFAMDMTIGQDLTYRLTGTSA